ALPIWRRSAAPPPRPAPPTGGRRPRRSGATTRRRRPAWPSSARASGGPCGRGSGPKGARRPARPRPRPPRRPPAGPPARTTRRPRACPWAGTSRRSGGGAPRAPRRAARSGARRHRPRPGPRPRPSARRRGRRRRQRAHRAAVVEGELGRGHRPVAAPPAAQLGHPIELALELAAAGAGALLPAAPHALEAAAHLVERLGELRPLPLERRQALEDLVRAALQLRLLDGLADDGEHREQRAGRAEHDLLPEGEVDQLAVVLVHEGVDGLVG